MSHEHCPASCLASSLLTHCSVMFRFWGFLTMLWVNPCRQHSVLHRHSRLHTAWLCAMVWHPYCGSVLDFCRYATITQAVLCNELSQCLFSFKEKLGKKVLSKERFVASLQVIYFTLHERFVKNKIHQFVDLCSISNVSSMEFHMQNAICISQICECCPFLSRFQCCSSPILALAITSTGIQCTDTQIQTWKKWTAIWKEKPCVFQQLHHHGCSTACWHYCDMCFLIVMLFSMWRSLCVDSAVSFRTPMCRHSRCLSPDTFGHSTKEYGIWATGCGPCVDLKDLRPRKHVLLCSVPYSVCSL